MLVVSVNMSGRDTARASSDSRLHPSAPCLAIDVDISHFVGSQQQLVLERCDPRGIVAGALGSDP
jgi:hypothetical protein